MPRLFVFEYMQSMGGEIYSCEEYNGQEGLKWLVDYRESCNPILLEMHCMPSLVELKKRDQHKKTTDE